MAHLNGNRKRVGEKWLKRERVRERNKQETLGTIKWQTIGEKRLAKRWQRRAKLSLYAVPSLWHAMCNLDCPAFSIQCSLCKDRLSLKWPHYKGSGSVSVHAVWWDWRQSFGLFWPLSGLCSGELAANRIGGAYKCVLVYFVCLCAAQETPKGREQHPKVCSGTREASLLANLRDWRAQTRP